MILKAVKKLKTESDEDIRMGEDAERSSGSTCNESSSGRYSDSKKRSLDGFSSSMSEHRDWSSSDKEFRFDYEEIARQVLGLTLSEREAIHPFESIAAGAEREGLKSPHGSLSVVGRRREMEDAVAVGGIGVYDFFGIYDGHNGSSVADTCRDRMHQLVGEELIAREATGGGHVTDWTQVMAQCFRRVEEELRLDAGIKVVGSTALVVMVGPDVLVTANCGDSRAVLARSGLVLPLSHDHKPNCPLERERIEAAGGRIIEFCGYRVEGILATSRSIGDWYLKPYISSDPEVTVMQRTESDDFVIIASDGLWDVMSNEDACAFVRKFLKGRTRSRLAEVLNGELTVADAAAQLLVELAMSRGSKDNISVVIVELNNARI